MKLEDITTLIQRLDFPRAGEAGEARAAVRPPRDHVRAVQEAVRAGLADAELPLELLGLEIARRDGAPDLAPFHVIPDVGVRMAFAYWRPGRAAGAHEHTDWTVTAVFHNRLDVVTFDWDATVRATRVVPKNQFSAEVGRVGHIYEPCIHDPRNPTPRWSISLHLFGPHDGPMLEAQLGPIEGLTRAEPRDDEADALAMALSSHERECVRRVQIEALAPRGPRAAPLLGWLHARGDAGTRRRAARALGRIEDLDPKGVLVRRWPGVDLDVAASGAHAELLARCGDRAQRLMRVDAWAEPALRALAAADAIRPCDLPGLAGPDQRALASALVDWGTFQPFTSGESTHANRSQGGDVAQAI